MNQMQRQHLAAEGAALQAGRPYCTLGGRSHLAWRDHKINATLDHFINTYSLAAREVAGGPL